VPASLTSGYAVPADDVAPARLGAPYGARHLQPYNLRAKSLNPCACTPRVHIQQIFRTLRVIAHLSLELPRLRRIGLFPSPRGRSSKTDSITGGRGRRGGRGGAEVAPRHGGRSRFCSLARFPASARFQSVIYRGQLKGLPLRLSGRGSAATFDPGLLSVRAGPPRILSKVRAGARGVTRDLAEVISRWRWLRGCAEQTRVARPERTRRGVIYRCVSRGRSPLDIFPRKHP